MQIFLLLFFFCEVARGKVLNLSHSSAFLCVVKALVLFKVSYAIICLAWNVFSYSTSIRPLKGRQNVFLYGFIARFFLFRSAGLVSHQTNRWSVRVILFLVFLFLFVVEHEMGREKTEETCTSGGSPSCKLIQTKDPTSEGSLLQLRPQSGVAVDFVQTQRIFKISQDWLFICWHNKAVGFLLHSG